MHILISNDDGFEAPGLSCLANSLNQLEEHKVSIVTTRENKSGSGQSLSLRQAINVERYKENFFIVDGTPADSVYLGLQNLVQTPVDIVISGINNGANLGDDLLYSGTFAAAMEARRLGLPSLAVSIIEHDVQYYETAANVVLELLKRINTLNVEEGLCVLNVNIPDIPYDQLRGFKATRLGVRHVAEKPLLEMVDGDQHYYRLGRSGEFMPQQGDEFDFQAVVNSFVSVTPVSSQLIHQPYIDDVQRWLNRL